eukprot:15352163-Ditylum_brightwellii.AAC.1
MVVSKVESSNDSLRRGIVITSVDGSEYTIMVCEQCTDIAWLEAMNMMFGSFLTRANSSGVYYSVTNQVEEGNGYDEET